MNTEQERVYLAIDLGAESGRVVAGVHRQGKLELEIVHRFPNGPISTSSGMRWDMTGLYKQIITGLKMAAQQWGKAIVSIGVDTWGVDYGLLDKHGNLLSEPHHYRDDRTNGMQEAVFKTVPRREVYETTGIQFLPFNTLYQLYAESQGPRDRLQQAENMLFVPDLINYWLTGRMANEITIASTGQFLDARTRQWATQMLDRLGIPSDLLGELVEPGQAIGILSKEVANRTGLARIDVVAVGGHDTASAVAAVPASGENWAYLSSGTWSLMGVELRQPVINNQSYGHGFTNEVGVFGTVRLLKNIGGLWLLQECRRVWEGEGGGISYAELVEGAATAPAFSRLIDPDEPSFATPGDMPARINDYLTSTGQRGCDDRGQMVRTILESLALRYAEVLDVLEDISGKKIDRIHIVGGGAKNQTLNQFTANATGRDVVAGPAEATAAGNILMQMISRKDLASLEDGRSLIAQSIEDDTYMQHEAVLWAEMRHCYQEITTG